MRTDAIRGLVDLLLLELIGDNWTHGWSLITQLREKSGGEIDLPEGTVYPALHRLRDAGNLDMKDGHAQGRRRRYYRITNLGHRYLLLQRLSWNQLKTAIDGVQSSIPTDHHQLPGS